MYGQWLGRIQGTNEGYVLLNVDRDRPNLGWLQVDDRQQPFSAFVALTVTGQNVSGQLVDFTVYGEARDGGNMPAIGQFNGIMKGNTLEGNWKTNVDTNGTFELALYETLQEYPADKTMPWRDFRQWILDDAEKFSSTIFRGHRRATYPLNTSFHRIGRRNLWRYTYEDVPTLCREVEATLDTRYSLNDANDFGGLLYLAQHHGYPTPLLDWTSPEISAKRTRVLARSSLAIF